MGPQRPRAASHGVAAASAELWGPYAGSRRLQGPRVASRGAATAACGAATTMDCLCRARAVAGRTVGANF